MDPHDLPNDIYEWERCYLAPVELRTEQETPERYRQRSFAMYCYYQRPRPQVLKAWAIQHEVPVGLTGFDVNEHFKRSGDYHIFRSEVSADGKKFSHVEVICVSLPAYTNLPAPFSRLPRPCARVAQLFVRRLSSRLNMIWLLTLFVL